MFSIFCRKSYWLWENVEKYGRAGKTRDHNIIRRKEDSICLPDKQGKNTDTHTIYNTSCSSTATMVTQTRLSVPFYVHRLSFFFNLPLRYASNLFWNTKTTDENSVCCVRCLRKSAQSQNMASGYISRRGRLVQSVCTLGWILFENAIILLIITYYFETSRYLIVTFLMSQNWGRLIPKQIPTTGRNIRPLFFLTKYVVLNGRDPHFIANVTDVLCNVTIGHRRLQMPICTSRI
jgi:hypothetical protein